MTEMELERRPSIGTGTAATAPCRRERLEQLRLLQLRFQQVRMRPLPATATDAQRRARRLADCIFPDRLAALRKWAEQTQPMPGAAWRALATDLRQLLAEIEGREVRDRRESTIREEGAR